MNSHRQIWSLLTGLFLVIAGLVVGVVGGVWFTTHYRIVPLELVGTFQSTSPPASALVDSSPGSDGSMGVLPAEAPKPHTSGPFAFKFTPGETLSYRLQASITGQGFESIGPSDINMALDGDMSLTTERVDASGNGELTLRYDRMAVDGNFMGSPFQLEHRRDAASGAQQASIRLNGNTTINTTQNPGSAKHVPQLEFLAEPIRMSVAPNGQVLRTSGGAGWGEALKELPGVIPVEFPEGELPQGLTWDSQFAMPVPGIAQPITAKMRNTVIGYQYVGPHYCAVIQQDIDSRQTDGRLVSPKSSMGDEAAFKMPLFDLTGRNMVYFDVQRGQLVRSESDLRFDLKIGSMLKQTAQVFSTAASDLSRIFGGPSSQGNNLDDVLGDLLPKDDSLDLSVAIRSTMALQ